MAPPFWVVSAISSMLGDGLTIEQIASQLVARKFPATPKMVKRIKEQHKLARQWKGSDAQLDSLVDEMRQAAEFGPDEGYRWVAEQVNKKVAPKRIGEKRVRACLARLMPAWVKGRLKAAQKRLVRRVYAAPYYLFADHIDLNCKLSFSGGVKLYIYGQVDGDSRYFRGLSMLFVKTARACYTQGYLPAIAEDADCIADVTTFDKGTEFNAIIYAIEAQNCNVNLTTSKHNIRIERP